MLLHPERALLWPAQRTAFIADLHLGKDEIFRRSGIPIPQGSTERDLLRLQTLVREHDVGRIVLLGDFLHGAARGIPTHAALFTTWRAAHADVEFVVVAGNHDRHSVHRELVEAVRWEREGLALGPFSCRHHPGPARVGHALCGHIHPMIRLRGSHREKTRLPVCWMRADHTVLPSFGSFTGGADIEVDEGDEVFAFAANRVWRVG